MARLPEGALMQRAAAGLAYAVIDLLGSAYGRRVLLLVGSGDNGGDALYAGALLARRGAQVEAWLLSDRAHEGGVAALRAAGGRVVRSRAPGDPRGADPRWWSTGSSGSAGGRAAGPSAQAALAAVAGRPGGRGGHPERRRRRHRRARRAARDGRRDRHLRHPQGRAPGRPGRRGRAARSTSSTSASTCPSRAVEALQPEDVAALLPRPAPDAQKYTRGVVGVRAGSRAVPRRRRCSASPARAAGWAAWSGTSGPPRSPTGSATPIPRSSARAGCRPGWSAPAAASTPATSSRAALADGVPVVSTPTRSPTSTRPAAGRRRADAARRRAGRDARRRARRRRGPPARARAPRGRDVRRVVLLKGRHTLVADPRRPGPGHHHRHALAGHRRRRRRARRAGRRAARRRPHAVRRRLGRLLAARRRGDPRRRGAARWSRARSRRPSRRPSGVCRPR